MGKSNAISAAEVRFQRWDSTASTPGWEDIAEITSLSGPGMSRDTIDVTHFGSEGWREFIAGLKDGGDVSLSMNFTRDTYQIMYDDFNNDDKQIYKVVLPDESSTSLEFEGLVTELPISADVGDKVSSDVSIKVSGKPEMYDGSSGSGAY